VWLGTYLAHPKHCYDCYIDTFHSDISEAFPNGEVSQYFRNDWLTQMCRETRANKEFAPRTQETARWAREQIKRQAGTYNKTHAKENAYTKEVLSVACWPADDWPTR
jgi:hypothetical protein